MNVKRWERWEKYPGSRKFGSAGAVTPDQGNARGRIAVRSILIAAVLGLTVVTQGLAFDPADEQKLKAGQSCDLCDLSGIRLMTQAFPKARLSRANLRESDLKGTDLSGADLGGADLRRANMEKINLTGANLEGSRLAGADMEKALLANANLERADIRDADLTKADLHDANLKDADLRGVLLKRVDLRGASLLRAPQQYKVGAVGSYWRKGQSV
jgi:uncharacterized protein YjbI with pentapeptide repeats